MKTTPLKIGKREFRLAFTLDAMCELEAGIEGFNLARLAEYTKSPTHLLTLIVALARQGELLEGRTLDVDRAWLGSHISPNPGRIAVIRMSVFNALSDGLRMETEEDEEDGEVDVVLQEIKKKETPGA